MNQILYHPSHEYKVEIGELNEFDFEVVNIIKNTKKSSSKASLNKYKLQFIISGTLSIICLIMFFINLYNNHQKEKISKKLLSLYNISSLYSDENHISEDIISRYSTPFVIGMIKIDKIDVNYPILSNSDKESLKISVCRFAGPLPNEIGNLCIAGHNYVDYKFFSRLHELTNGDIIKIYDGTGHMIEYSVYAKYEVDPNDMACTSQDTDGERIVTLLTCNNVNGKRLIIQAKENR